MHTLFTKHDNALPLMGLWNLEARICVFRIYLIQSSEIKWSWHLVRSSRVSNFRHFDNIEKFNSNTMWTTAYTGVTKWANTIWPHKHGNQNLYAWWPVTMFQRTSDGCPKSYYFRFLIGTGISFIDTLLVLRSIAFVLLMALCVSGIKPQVIDLLIVINGTCICWKSEPIFYLTKQGLR